MEDEDSKIRRNFLAVSALIVLAWWLQAPLDRISEKLLGVSSVGPNFEWRAWAAATAVLVYFGLRFRFSKEHSAASNDMLSEATKVKRALLLRWLNWEVMGFVKWHWTPPVFGSSFSAVVGESGPHVQLRRSPIVRIKVSELQLGRQTGTGVMIMPEAGELFGSVRLEIDRRQDKATEIRRWNWHRPVGWPTGDSQRLDILLACALFEREHRTHGPMDLRSDGIDRVLLQAGCVVVAPSAP